MTTQELITELSRSLGNRTDIDNTRYVLWLNWSILEICSMWRGGLISPVRFHALEGYKLFATSIVSNVTVSATTTGITLAAGDVEADDYYNDMVIEITAYDEDGAGTDTPSGLLYQKRVIYDYTQSTNTAVISEAWDTTPDEYTTYSIYKRKYSILTDLGISPISSLMAFQRIEKQSDSTEIPQVEWRELIGSNYTSTGEANQFAVRGDYLILDPTPNEAVSYRVYYYRYPSLFTTDNLSAECELPVDWHEIVLMGAVSKGFDKLMEPDRAAESNKKFIASAIRQSASSIEDGEISYRFKIKRD